MRTAAVILSISSLTGFAQVPQASLDTSVIRIGEQATILLSVEYHAEERPVSVQWPVVGDTLTSLVEVVSKGPVDTVAQASEFDPLVARLEHRLTITSFDTGFHAVPPFRFLINGRPSETRAMLIEVRGMALDSTHALRDIQDIIEPPFSVLFWLREHVLWLGGSVVMAVLATLLWWHFRNRLDQSEVFQEEPPLPLHERVIAELRVLEAERLWQQGLHKVHHSRTTDLLRGYIEGRYGIPALERTTDELLQELSVSPLSPDQRTSLANMLRMADMVKFAKAVPTPTENERMVPSAILWVQGTAPTSNGPATQTHAH